MRPALTLIYQSQARRDLESIRAWSPTQAGIVVESLEWMTEAGYRALGRRIMGGRRRWWLVPRTTLAVVYWVRDSELRVTRVRQVRRLRRLPD